MARDGFNFDVKLEYAGGAPKLYNLAEQEGVLAWNEGLVEALVPQQNTGGLSRTSLPATISSLIAFEDWSGGAGAVVADPGEAAPNRYSFSRGIDASLGDRLILSPQKQDMTGITSVVKKFYTSATYGELAMTARYVYLFSGGSWVQQYDAGSDILTDLIEYENTVACYLVLARGDSNDIVYSAGTTFGSTSTGNTATWLAVRGHTALEPILYGITAKGAVASCTAIATFTAADQVGSRGESVNGVETANNLIVMLKDEGVYTFNGADVSQKLASNSLYRPTNGKAHTVWPGNGFVYFNFDNRVLEYDPFNDAFRTVYFPEHPELNGDITAMDGNSTHLYFTITNFFGDVYMMKGNPNVGKWDTLEHLSTEAVNAIHLTRQGAIHATNDILTFDGGSETGYYILAQDGLRPEDDTAYRYRTTTGHIYGPLTDGGVFSMTKRINGVRAIGENMSASNAVAISFGRERVDTTPTSALSLVEEGLQEARITADTPFTRLHYYATMDNAGAEVSPRLLSIVFDTTPYPPRRRRFRFTVELEWRPAQGSGVARRDSFTALRRHLFGSVNYPVTLTDPFDGTFIGKVQDIQCTGYRTKDAAGMGTKAAFALYTVVVDEITETTEGAAEAVWDASDWNDGRVWGDG